jgi:hypothetical protein
MKQYKVIDPRRKYRDDNQYHILADNKKKFIFINSKNHRISGLNPRKFQEERIVDEQEATLLILKGIQLEEIKNEK